MKEQQENITPHNAGYPAPIWDNRERTVAQFLQERLTPGAFLRVVSAYFTIYGYQEVKQRLAHINKMHFLYGAPDSVTDLDPKTKAIPPFVLTENGIKPTETLKQKALASECAEWITEKAEIRTIKEAGLMHGKMYHISNGNHNGTLVGSSNFTARGLGVTENSNIELNHAVQSSQAEQLLAKWFDNIWHDKKLTQDAKKDVLEALERLAKDYSPEFVYYKTLFELFYDRIREREEEGKQLKEQRLHETEIWKKLYKFQQDGVHGAIHRLRKHNGCIIADSVGLGKTFVALAIIKYYESREKNCLVLCPKRLEENWKRYSTRYERQNNSLKADYLDYRVLAHTDLSRKKGEKDGIELNNFDWGKYHLIIIDESHNFRNTGSNKYDEQGNIIGKSRYNLLMDKVIKVDAKTKVSVKTKVLMLSATPVNTDLTDLRNQIKLMTEGENDSFAELGIPSLDSFFAQAQKNFNAWEGTRTKTKGRENKEALLEKLGSEFQTLLDAVSIARSRHHIETYYPEVTKDLGGFPHRAQPENRTPATDSSGKLSYEDMYERISNFELSIYNPSEYLKEGSNQEEKKTSPQDPFSQKMRERFLIGMLRVNFLKRLESSAEAFRLTLERTLERMNTALNKIEKMTKNTTINGIPNNEEYEEDEDLIVGKRMQYHLTELDTKRWEKDLKEDRKVLQEIYNIAKEVNESRDAKLHTLKHDLLNRIQNPTKNKEGHPCHKALIFTAFSDTAKYLYKNLTTLANQHNIKIALVTGGNNETNANSSHKFNDILDNFSPRTRKEKHNKNDEIDFLIATDCIAEGQDLQDCDLVINYDIHWNPTRLIQRFGRIDRIGSLAKEVHMINFWPTKDLEQYLNLQNRVEARMALADATATGHDNLLLTKKAVQIDLDFRNNQLRQISEGAKLWDEGAEDNEQLKMSDFTLDDFIAQLITYLETNKNALETAPLGIYALTNSKNPTIKNIPKGTIFCLKHINPPTTVKKHKTSPLQPYYLAYISTNGNIFYRARQAKQILELMGTLCRNEKEASTKLSDTFNTETQNGQNMQTYNILVEIAIKSIQKDFFKTTGNQLGGSRGFLLPKINEQPIKIKDFELITWLIIK